MSKDLGNFQLCKDMLDDIPLDQLTSEQRLELLESLDFCLECGRILNGEKCYCHPCYDL